MDIAAASGIVLVGRGQFSAESGATNKSCLGQSQGQEEEDLPYLSR